MREVDSTPATSSQHPFEQAAFGQDQPAPNPLQFQQAAFTANLSGPFVEIPTLFTNNPNIDLRGFYSAQSTFAQLYNHDSSSVGHLIARDKTGAIQEWASATYVSSSGLAVTDLHAIKSATGSIEVTSNGQVHQARVLDVDPKTDLALLQVLPATSGETFSPVHFGSSQLAAGEDVTIMGFPRRSDNLHISPGTFAADLRAGQIPMAGGLPQGEDANRTLVEISANIQTGNSGGPAFRDNGDAIGIASSTDQGRLALLTPAEDVVAFIQRSQHDFPSTAAAHVLGSNRNYYDRAISQLPDWMASRLDSTFGRPQPAALVAGHDPGTNSWSNYISNFSLRQLLS